MDDVADLVQEEHVDLRGGADLAQVGPPAHQLSDGKNTVVGAQLDVVQQLSVGVVVELLHIDVAHAALQGADGLQDALLEGPADGHDLAGGLHLGAEAVAGGAEFVKGEPGHLRHHVVQGGLEAGGGIGQPDLLQVHPHGDLGGHTGNGIPAGLAG